MMHDPTKVLLGTNVSSSKELSAEVGDSGTFKAGLAVRRSSSGGLQLADDSTAALIGVSAGQDLAQTNKIAVFRTGLGIPVKLKNDAASVVIGDLTFTAKLFGTEGNDITVTLADTVSAGAETVEVDGTDITINIEGGVSTAQQIADAIEASEEASELVSVAIASGQEAVAQAAAAQDSLEGGSDVAVVGEAVKIDDTTGEASVDGGTTTAAVYTTGKLTGVYPDGTETEVALIDMPGGL